MTRRAVKSNRLSPERKPVHSCSVKLDNLTGICISRVSDHKGKPVTPDDRCRHGHAWDYRAEQYRAATRCGECESFKSEEKK